MTNLRKMLAASCLLAVLCTGCAAFTAKTTLNADYVSVDVDFEAMLGDPLEACIANDPVLSDEERSARLVALKAWRAMVAVAAEAEGVQASGGGKQ